MPSEKDVVAFRSEMHAAAEARMSQFNPFTQSQLEEMRRAAPDDVCRDLAHDARAPIGPRSQASTPVSNDVRGPVVAPGAGTGWARNVELSNPAGVNYADRLMDHQDAKDREALILQEAQRRILQKATEPK